MVPSIYPLETLHNCLSLCQVSDFLTTLSGSCPDFQPRPGTGNPLGGSRGEGPLDWASWAAALNSKPYWFGFSLCHTFGRHAVMSNSETACRY